MSGRDARDGANMERGRGLRKRGIPRRGRAMAAMWNERGTFRGRDIIEPQESVGSYSPPPVVNEGARVDEEVNMDRGRELVREGRADEEEVKVVGEIVFVGEEQFVEDDKRIPIINIDSDEETPRKNDDGGPSHGNQGRNLPKKPHEGDK